MVKSFKFIVHVFEFSAGCIRERKRYQNNIINYAKSIPKSMKNQCWSYARKSDAQMMENAWKIDAKLEPKSIKMMKKRGPENDAKKKVHARTSLEGRRVWRTPYSLDLNIYNSYLLRLSTSNCTAGTAVASHIAVRRSLVSGCEPLCAMRRAHRRPLIL